jgi:hypothetical protein
MSTFLASIQILKKAYSDLVGVILLDGQPAYDETNNVLRIGDGSTAFESLPTIQANQEFTFDVTIPSADVLDIFSTPFELVPAQGANTIIVPTSIQGQMIYGTTPYATDGEIDIYCGGTRSVFILPPDDGFLFGTVSRVVNGFAASSNNVTDTQYVANQPLTIKTVGANPTAGDSDIRIFGTYKVIDIS